MKQRLIDANALRYHMGVNQNDKQIFYITGEDIDAAPTIDPESLFFTIGKRADDLEKLYTEMQAVTGLTPERLLELFLEGYTLQAPDYRKNFEEMQRMAELRNDHEL